MKKLEDLKKEILDNIIAPLYVFYGEDFGIRKHYIKKIGENFDRITYINNLEELNNRILSPSLFQIKELFVIYNDENVLKLNPAQINTMITRLNPYSLILDYDNLNNKAIDLYGDRVTYFPHVQNNIAMEFVDSEISVFEDTRTQIAYNCENDYNKILLEADKIKNYSEAFSISNQKSFENLTIQQQLIQNPDKYDCNWMMNDILIGNKDNYAYWINLIENNYKEEFRNTLSLIFNDLLIAYCITSFGKWNGSSLAYNLKLSWYRAKQIREFYIPYKPNYLLYCANNICEFDRNLKTGKYSIEEILVEFWSLF